MAHAECADLARSTCQPMFSAHVRSAAARHLWADMRGRARPEAGADPRNRARAAEPPSVDNVDAPTERQIVARFVVMDTNRIVASPAFANLPAEELNEFAGAMREVDAEAGVTVVGADDYGTAIYLIEAGNADVLNDAGDAIKALGPGDTFGEIGLLLTGQRTATVVARTPMRLLSLSGQDFDRIRPHVPETERALRRLALFRAGQ